MRTASMRLLMPMLGTLLTGCALPYYLHTASGQLRLMRQRVPIAEVVADPAYDATTRTRLALVDDLRHFAVAEIALPDNDSYTSYVELGRDSVVWNVIAAPEFSIDPVTWCFPVAGCVAYRGYFEPELAERFGDKLRARGYDVFVGGSPAYSTLGHFDDPVLDTMLDRGETAIAGTLFHELAHQRIYVKDDTELSESFATAVEQYAVERWLRSRGEAGALERYRARLARQREFADLVGRQRDRLARLFAEELDVARLRRAKAAAYAELRREYDSLKRSWGGISDYDAWFDGGFDNARLVAVTSYQRWVPGLRSRLDAVGPDAFYTEVGSLLEVDPESRMATLSSWNEASVVGALPDRRELIDAAREVGVHDRMHSLRLDPESREAVLATNARDGQ